VLMCEECWWHGACERCDANLTWHRSAGLLCCHHCGHQRRVPPVCPDCRADALSSAGEGTQQLELALQNRFPGVAVLRFDRDSTSRKGSFVEQAEQVARGGPCVLAVRNAVGPPFLASLWSSWSTSISPCSARTFAPRAPARPCCRCPAVPGGRQAGHRDPADFPPGQRMLAL
jgi:hypothetical protein